MGQLTSSTRLVTEAAEAMLVLLALWSPQGHSAWLRWRDWESSKGTGHTLTHSRVYTTDTNIVTHTQTRHPLASLVPGFCFLPLLGTDTHLPIAEMEKWQRRETEGLTAFQRWPQLLSGPMVMAWGLPLLSVHPETLTVEGVCWHLSCQLWEEVSLLLGTRGKLGLRVMMPPLSPCSVTSCLQGDWRYQPSQGLPVSREGSVGTQIRSCVGCTW